ncbi:MAG: YhdH/YhfP family quinone oxidoreductase [Candidatus Anammoxibacter sp.]
MSISSFKAMIVTEDNGSFVRKVDSKSINDLPDGEALIKVGYSSLNYKDALSATGNKGITQNYPHTPGIDAAGIIVSSASPLFKEGDEVICTSYDLGMNTPGGFGKYIRVPASWIVKLPDGLTLKESMIYGTAGLTAALSLHKLELAGIEPNGEEVLITGATGGVGSMAVAILSKAGHNVVAATGKSDKEEYLKQIGANRVIGRDEVNDAGNKPILKGKWHAVVDTVGGNILATAIKSTRQWGSVAACGLTQSTELNTSVFPFILRGVNLLGINSEHCPMDLRTKIWNRISQDWKIEKLDTICTECSLVELDEKIDLILKGKITGRIVVNLDL